MKSLPLLVGFLIASTSFTAAAHAAAATRPNVLLIVADDLGVMDLGFDNPNTFYETPNLDRFARQGVRFTDAYAACPVCSPSRYAIQTGKYPTRSGLTNYLPANRQEKFQGGELTLQMASEEITLAEAVKPAGYGTAFVGKWHLGAQPIYWPEHQGYDTNIAGCSRGSPSSYFSPYQNPRLPDGPKGEYLPQRTAGETVQLLERFKREGKPFFLCYCDYLVHIPLQAPAAVIDKYAKKAAARGLDPKGEFGDEVQYHQTKVPRKVRLTQSHPTYSAMMEGLDNAVGEILSALDRLGLADNTLVIFTSDNGGLSTAEGTPTSNLPYRDGKGWVYEGGIREPFVARWPAGKLPAGAVRSAPVIGLDIYPTLLEATGAAVPSGVKLDGRSILPAARGETVGPRNLFWHYPHYSNQGAFPGAAVRSGDLKLVENLEDGRTFLYDLKADPGEQRDLAKERPDDAARLLTLLSDWQRETGARFLRQRDGGPMPWHPDWFKPAVSVQSATSGPTSVARTVQLEPWQRTEADD